MNNNAIDKVALLILSNDKTKFLVCSKDPQNVTDQWIMPGGTRCESNESDENCLIRIIPGELSCDVIPSTLEYISQYEDVAAGLPHRTVSVRLYKGMVRGTPRPAGEIERFKWIGRDDWDDEQISPVVRNKILPDLLDRSIIEQAAF